MNPLKYLEVIEKAVNNVTACLSVFFLNVGYTCNKLYIFHKETLMSRPKTNIFRNGGIKWVVLQIIGCIFNICMELKFDTLRCAAVVNL